MNSTPICLAHRGFSGKYPENTRLAFTKAMEIDGCMGFETDVHRTKDGKLVIIHDPILGRTSNGSGYVRDHTYEELLRLDLGSWMSPEFTGERIMLWSEMLDLCKENNLLCNLEVKNYEVFYDGIEKQIIDEIVCKNMQDKVFLSSFNHISMEICKKVNPEIKTGLLYDKPLHNVVEYVSTTSADAVHPRYVLFDYEPTLVDEYHALGKAVHTWTVNEESDMKKAINLGVDSIITNYPDALCAMLKKII